jgi:integrase/recombinase XerD
MIREAIDSYLALRRAQGFVFRVQERLIREFARFACQRGDGHIRTSTVLDWASQPSSLCSRDHRLRIVAAFAHHLQLEDPQHEIPPANVFGFRKTRRIPFIFTPEQIHRFLEAATQLRPLDSLRPHTYGTLFALLATTGLRIREARGLRFQDLTADGLLVLRTKFNKSRLVPLHETAVAGLDRFLERRKRMAAADDHVFVSLHGRKLSHNAIDWTFRDLLKITGLDRGRGGRRPRIQDLRNTFAVRALEGCPEGRDNISRHMLALSTYMGHGSLRNTYWYLEATPHLMRDIAEACEAFLSGGAR